MIFGPPEGRRPARRGSPPRHPPPWNFAASWHPSYRSAAAT